MLVRQINMSKKPQTNIFLCFCQNARGAAHVVFDIRYYFLRTYVHKQALQTFVPYDTALLRYSITEYATPYFKKNSPENSSIDDKRREIIYDIDLDYDFLISHILK